MLFTIAACLRRIVKIGSALLVEVDGTVRRDWLATLVADIAARVGAGQQVAVVSSGAIARGARRLKVAKCGRASLEDAEASATVGQIAHPLSGELRHGFFAADRSAPARKAWPAGGLTAADTIDVGAGAAAAPMKGGSLPAAGVTAIEGSIARGDPVALLDHAPVAALVHRNHLALL